MKRQRPFQHNLPTGLPPGERPEQVVGEIRTSGGTESVFEVRIWPNLQVLTTARILVCLVSIALFSFGCSPKKDSPKKEPARGTSETILDKALRELSEDPNSSQLDPKDPLHKSGLVAPLVNADQDFLAALTIRWTSLCENEAPGFTPEEARTRTPSKATLVRLRLVATVAWNGTDVEESDPKRVEYTNFLIHVADSDPISLVRAVALTDLFPFPISNRESLRVLVKLVHDLNVGIGASERVWQDDERILRHIISESDLSDIPRAADQDIVAKAWDKWLSENLLFTYFDPDSRTFRVNQSAKREGREVDALTGIPK